MKVVWNVTVKGAGVPGAGVAIVGDIVHVVYFGNVEKGGHVGVTGLENSARLSFGSETT